MKIKKSSSNINSNDYTYYSKIFSNLLFCCTCTHINLNKSPKTECTIPFHNPTYCLISENYMHLDGGKIDVAK